MTVTETTGTESSQSNPPDSEVPSTNSNTVGSAKSQGSSDWSRETIESLAVALILAFLFRAFVAEAFVIPTGSMAPTLMGAHKDSISNETQFGYQCGASLEFNTNTGANSAMTAVGTVDPLSRLEQPVDLKNNPNDATFSGDRILVSKFSYLWSDPSRWDVVVFKYPRDARLNYIKRCVGLPNESLRIEHGDIYTKPNLSTDKGVQANDALSFNIARKPPNVIEAMLQPVSDTNYLPHRAIEAGMPSYWQPSYSPGEGNPAMVADKASRDKLIENGWVVEQTLPPKSGDTSSDKEGASREGVKVDWSASLGIPPADGSVSWLRYYHRVLSPQQWTTILKSGKLPAPISPYSSRLISDFTAYNGTIKSERHNVYDNFGNVLDDYDVNWVPNDISNPARSSFSRYSGRFENDGMHWAPDLAAEFDLDFSKQADSVSKSGKSQSLVLDLVEAGVHYQCSIDLVTGDAKLAAIQNGKSLTVFEVGDGGLMETPTGMTPLRASGKHTVKFANVDNTLHLWVDRKLVAFTPSNLVRTDSDAILKTHRPQATAQDPLDAAPVGIGLRGASVRITRARVWRDVYYIAVEGEGANMIDDQNFDSDLIQSVNETALKDFLTSTYLKTSTENFTSRTAIFRDVLFSSPVLWEKSPYFKNRDSVQFELGEDQFFPMGDNSAASSDARAWNQNHFVPRRLLIGRAVMVFWPHPWFQRLLGAKLPIPNFSRIGLIR